MAARKDSVINEALTEKLRVEYVEGVEEDGIRSYPTIDQLVKKYQVPANTLYRRSQEANWQTQRNFWQSEYQEKRNRDRARAKAKRAEKFDDTSLTIAEGILARVGRKLSIALRRDQSEGADSLSISELRDMAETVVKAQRVGKLSLGEAAEIKQVVSDDAVPDSLSRIIGRLDELGKEKSQRADHTLQ